MANTPTNTNNNNTGSSYSPPISAGERAPTIISESTRMKGNLHSDGDIHIDGKVDGDLRANVITIGPKGIVVGKIFADHLRVSGRVVGDITARIAELYGHAHIEGNILHEILAIEAGSHIDGLCRKAEVTPLLESPEHDDEIMDANVIFEEKKSGKGPR
ncbi:MAG: polymer-forming cytoskeletal protein [Alphaproteobacteria bacterium]|nr:polymer-forming cytoskeletal protein [Alphaproteobacteria bacterium]